MRATRDRRPTRRRLLGAALAAATALLLATGPASADQNNPTDQDVQNAKSAVATAAASVAAMELQLARLDDVMSAAQVKMQQADEAYVDAKSTADQAASDASAAAAQAATADQNAQAARVVLVALARQMANSGGTSDVLEAVLSADGFADVTERADQLGQLTDKADQAVQQYKATQLVSRTLNERAQAKSAQAATAAAAAQTALAAAQQSEKDAASAVASASAQHDQLVAQLAAAQQTSVQVEQARQAELAAEQQAREEAAAQAAAQAAAAKAAAAQAAAAQAAAAQSHTSSSSSGSSSGSSSSGSSSSGSSSSGSSPSSGSGSSSGSAAAGRAAVSWAIAQVGTPYGWGDDGPDSFDCSGLTQQAWASVGVSLPHSSRTQYLVTKKVAISDLRPGDLLFWASDTTDPSTIYHVAMWVGGGQIVEAPVAGVPVRVTAMRWAGTMPFAGRP